MNKKLKYCSAVLVVLMSVGCSSLGDVSLGSDNKGKSGLVTSGSAAGGTSSGENSALEKCSSPLGTVALTENVNSDWYSLITGQYKLPPASKLLRLIIQQSNCFVVVERGGSGMRAMARERALMGTGEFRKGSNFKKGQMVAADYGLEPEINFSENDVGGIAGVIGGLIGGGLGSTISAVGAATKTREASTLLILVDNRSGVQIAAAEGSASKMDIGLAGGLFSAIGLGAAAGAYTKTPEGKVITAAFLDSYNNMVRALREYKAQNVKGGLGKGGQLKVGD